jgi:riboflavin kinase/FMN adenylyltransferase
VRIEAHLLDFKGNLYDRNVAVEVMGFIRPERKFPDPQALMQQIFKDVEMIRNILKGKEL